MKAALQAMSAQLVNVALATLLVAVWLGLSAYLDTPSETDALLASSLDLSDAIQQARVAAKEMQ